MTSAATPHTPLQIAVTTGEPAGVGPELTAQALAAAAARWPDAQFIVLGDASLLEARAQAVGIDWQALLRAQHVSADHHPLGVPVRAGKLDAANGRYVLGLLDTAIDGALAGQYDAIVTAPLQKSTINDAGVPF